MNPCLVQGCDDSVSEGGSDPLSRCLMLRSAWPVLVCPAVSTRTDCGRQHQLAWALRSAVDECKAAGESWQGIGEAIGLPREAVYRQYEAGGPMVTAKPVQSSGSRFVARQRYETPAIYAFQDETGHWYGQPDALADGQFGIGTLSFNPANPDVTFAGQQLRVRYGLIEHDVSFYACRVREPDGHERQIRLTYEVFDLLFGDGQTPLRRAMAAAYHAIALNPAVPSELREVVDRAADAQSPSVPVREFQVAVQTVVDVANTVGPIESRADLALEQREGSSRSIEPGQQSRLDRHDTRLIMWLWMIQHRGMVVPLRAC